MSETGSVPLKENEHFKELLSILKENGKETDAIGLAAFAGYVSTMESQLKMAAEDLKAVQMELNTMREERTHPLRTAIQNAAQSMEANINETRIQLESLKDKIIDGCKQAVTAFKEKGISALNGVAKFFKIKPALESLRSSMETGIKKDQDTIAKIEAMSAEYHTAGRSVKNIGRAIIGKEMIPDIKPNGKLAKLAEAPFRSEIKRRTSALKTVDKAITAFERLEKSVPQKDISAEDKQDRPSTRETMKRLAEKISGDKKEALAPDKVKQKEEVAI